MAQTAARVSFGENWLIVDELKGLRDTDAVTTHSQRAALNRSGIIFLITAWEAYIEDVAIEVADHIAERCEKYNNLPHQLKSIISEGVPRKWQLSDVADGGWRDIVSSNARTLTSGNKFNTPNRENTDDLLKKVVGIPRISDYWAWQSFPVPRAAERLDESIGIRGEIVHTGRKPDGLNKRWLLTYGNNIEGLVEKTDAALLQHAYEVTGWSMAVYE